VSFPAFPALTSGALWARHCANELTAESGDFITAWPDSSGNGHDAAGTGMMIRDSIINGRPAVRFVAADHQYLTLPAIPIPAFRIFSAVRVRPGGSSYRSIVGGNIDAPDLYIAQTTNYLELSRSNRTLVASSGHAVPTNTALVLGVKCTSADATFYVGASDPVASYGPFSHAVTFLSGAAYIAQSYPSTAVQYLEGDVAEVVILGAAATDADQALVLDYLVSAYLTPEPPPSSGGGTGGPRIGSNLIRA
jgi:hypothetical protein